MLVATGGGSSLFLWPGAGAHRAPQGPLLRTLVCVRVAVRGLAFPDELPLVFDDVGQLVRLFDPIGCFDERRWSLQNFLLCVDGHELPSQFFS